MKNTKIPSLHRHRFHALCTVAALSVTALGLTAQAESWLFDFGASGTTTIGIDDPLNTWNNVTEVIGSSNTGSLLNLLTTSNVATDVDLLMVSRFNNSNTNGTLASTQYVSEATRDSLYGNTGVFGGFSNITPIFKLTALDPSLTYSFRFYASRIGAGGDNRETVYTVSGSLSGTAALNASENVDNTVTVSGITPDLNGEIQISLAPGPNNNNGGTGSTATRFIYLGVMEMQSIPEPATAVMLGGSSLMLAARRRRQR